MGFILNYDFGHLSGQQRGIVTSCDGSCSGRAGRVDHVDIWTDFPTILGGRPFAWGKCSSEIRLNTSQVQFGKGKCPFLANGLLQILIPYFLVPVGTSRKSLWHDDTPSSTITKFNSPHLNAFFLGGVPPLKNHFKKTPPQIKNQSAKICVENSPPVDGSFMGFKTLEGAGGVGICHPSTSAGEVVEGLRKGWMLWGLMVSGIWGETGWITTV